MFAAGLRERTLPASLRERTLAAAGERKIAAAVAAAAAGEHVLGLQSCERGQCLLNVGAGGLRERTLAGAGESALRLLRSCGRVRWLLNVGAAVARPLMRDPPLVRLRPHRAAAWRAPAQLAVVYVCKAESVDRQVYSVAVRSVVS